MIFGSFVCKTRFVFMALMEYCLVNVVLGDHEFVWAIRRARAPVNQQDSPVIVSFFFPISLFHLEREGASQ